MSKRHAGSGILIGIDLGGTNIKGVRLESGKIVGSAHCSTDAALGPKVVLQNICSVVFALTERGRSGAKTELGLSIPGEVNGKGKIWRLPSIGGFEHVAIASALERVVGMRVRAVENDAACAAVAEHKLGAARTYTDFLQVTLGTGIGGGLVLNDRLYRGRNGFAAEIGHVTVHHSGRRCGCGAKGCVEAYASAGGIVRTYRELGGEGRSVADIAKRAASGEARALKAFEEAGRELGRALASILNVLDLQAIVFSGGIRRALRFMKPALVGTLREHCMGAPVARVPLMLTRLGDDVGAIGAALLAGERAARVGE